MHGWCGKVLRVNLSNGTVAGEALDPQVARDYIGARGFGIYYLTREVDPTCDPLGPENKIIMAAGPLTGTAAPTGARYVVTTKSPLTGAITCSNSGGNFPAELKKSGHDAIILEGASPRPVYLWIGNGAAELRPAEHLWGRSVPEADELLRRETDPKAKTAVIGPAGERKVLFAAIMNDRDRAAGRAGVGAVMGSKNLKAVAVKGDGEVSLADPAAFKAVNTRYRDAFKAKTKDNPPALRTHGTAITSVGTQAHGVFPTRNFQQGTFEGWEAIGGEELTRKYLVRPKPCFSCPIACGRVTRVPDGPFQGEGEGPEYETVYALGSNCGVDDLAALTKANYLCNELGLDTISMGCAIACAMELFEKGALTEADSGMPLRWGDGPALVALTRMTAVREGFGDVLAEGSLRLAARYGRPGTRHDVQGARLRRLRPARGAGIGAQLRDLADRRLAHARRHRLLRAAGRAHCGRPAHLGGQAAGRGQVAGPVRGDRRGRAVRFLQRAVSRRAEPDGQTGGDHGAPERRHRRGFTAEEVERAGERIFNAERLFLVAAGFGRAQDTLPPRMTREPMPSGPAKGMVCRLEEMLVPYYQLRGWTPEGVPTEEKLRELGLR